MIRTAGMVQGTPDWQLDRAYETETAEILEKAYAQDDFPAQIIESLFDQASGYISQAVRCLIRASEEAEKYGREKYIDDLIQALDDDFLYDMMQALKKVKEGS